MVSTAEMGVQTMTEQSENKVTTTDTIDKSKQPPAALTKPVKDEQLSEQELEKASGGGGRTWIEIGS